MRRRPGFEIVGILILVGYVTLVTVFGRFVGLDEPASKAAGRDWGLNGHWAAPELAGWLPYTEPPVEQFYGMYPPLYAFGFGLLVRLVGFGWRQCVFYDAAIHASLAFLAVHATRKLGGKRFPAWLGWLVSLAILPLGTAREARPDELAACFGIGGLLLLLSAGLSLSRVLGSGLLFGLCGGTSLGAAAMLTMIAAMLVLTREVSWFRRLSLGLVWTVVAGTTFALIVVPLLVSHPGLLDQFRANSRTTLRLNQTFVQRIVETLLPVLTYYRDVVISVLGPGLVGLLLSLRLVWNGEVRRWCSRWLGPIGAVSFWLATTCKPLYLWFLGPWLIALAVTELASSWSSLNRLLRGAALLVLAASLVLGSELTIRESMQILSLPPSQKQDWNQRVLEAVIPPGSVVLTADAWWFLAGDRVVYDLSFARPDMEKVDFVVLSGNGSVSSGLPKIRNFVGFEAFPLLEKFRPVSDNLNRSWPTLWGRPLARHTNGFGTLVLERISRDVQGKPSLETQREHADQNSLSNAPTD